MERKIKLITHEQALDFIMPKHYAGRKPQITKAFGWYEDDRLVAACTFGKPASHQLCDGICGKEFSSSVYELNRLVREEDFDGQLSQFVSGCLRELKKENWIIVSYADSGMTHHGYIYQATNFIYTGCTKQRTDRYVEGKHSRHADVDNPKGIRQVRTAKHRYVYFCTSDKKLKKQWKEALNYPILPYPKGDNENYELGRVYSQVLIDKDKNIIHRENEYVMKSTT